MLPRPLPYQVYRLSGWSGCLQVLCCLVFAGVLLVLCHGSQVCLLLPDVGRLLMVQVK